MPGLGKKTFTAGDVLIAGDVNNFLMDQTVMVFATAAARTAAIPTPSQGMTTYRSDINALEIYNGAAWLGATGLTGVAPTSIANTGGTASMSGITTTFAGVTSLSLNGVFRTGFRNYRIILEATSTTTVAWFSARLRTAGTDNNSASYNLVSVQTANDTALTRVSNVNLTLFDNFVLIGDRKLLATIDISTPFASDQTLLGYQSSTGAAGVGSKNNSVAGAARFNNTTSFDGISFFGATFTGNVIVYGYNQ